MESRTLTQDELATEARARFGDDPKTWAFQCPHCGDVANAQDFIDAEADPNRVGQECIGRSLGALTKDATGTDGRKHAKRGCDWAAYGLFRGPWFINDPGQQDRRHAGRGELPAGSRACGDGEHLMPASSGPQGCTREGASMLLALALIAGLLGVLRPRKRGAR